MKPIVLIQTQGGRKIEPYQEAVREIQEFLRAGGIGVQFERPRVAEVAASFALSIAGGIATHYIVKLIESLMRTKKANKDDDVKIVVLYHATVYLLPNDHRKLMDSIEAERPGTE